MNKPAKRTAYQKPQLTAFGSVRNLTGGSAGNMMDANGDMTAGLTMN